ncbi:MAG TPA: hypothetical protein VFI65_09145 [Streptosporangiaceae bacterium]|nr:hypothetical protein [Streptosporangiaceae bacterium]
MTRRSGRGGDNGGCDDNGLRQPDVDAEVAATTTAIAGLRRRLRSPGSLDHPSVRRELRKLADELAELEDGKRRPGRHRSNVSRLPLPLTGPAGGPTGGGPSGGPTGGPASEQANGAPKTGRRPDPTAAGATSEFIASLWQFRAWAGDPSWRKIAARSHYKAVHSTIYSAMHGTTLPKLIVVKAIILGCGGNDDDLAAYCDAWWRIGSASVTDTGTDTELLPAPVPALS